MNKQTAKLRFWIIHKFPQVEGYYLTGDVYDHPYHEDSEWVKTSRLLRIDFEKCEAETSNTIYSLEEI